MKEPTPEQFAVLVEVVRERVAMLRSVILSETEVYVRRHPNDWQTATYRLSDVEGLHWDDVSGGAARKTSHSTLFGYVWCDGAVSGEVAHSCRHGEGPHRIKVCLPKGQNKAEWQTILAFQKTLGANDAVSCRQK